MMCQRPNRTWRLVCCVLAAVTMAAVGVPVQAQVSARILVDGQAALTVPSQQVDLDVTVRVETTLSLSVLQFTLDASAPELFEFVDPPLTVGEPWQPEDLYSVRPEVSAGDLLSVQPDILLFKLALPEYPASSYPVDVLTFSLRSTDVLPPGQYTFAIGGVSLPPVWGHTREDLESEEGEIASAGIFTLTVTAPASGGDTTGPDTNDTSSPPPWFNCGFGTNSALAVGMLAWVACVGVRRRGGRHGL